MVITLLNPSTDDLEKTYLSNSIAAGVTSLPVKNNDRFSSNDRIMIGEMGQEKTEIVSFSTNVGNTAITVGATIYPHSADDPVYKLQFDQARLYRSTSGISGSYSVISTQDIDVDNANMSTIYNDTAGLAGYYYKWTVYHSLQAIESSFSDPIVGSGNARNTVGVITDELLKEFGDDAENVIDRGEMLAWMNELHDDIHSRFTKPPGFLLTRISLSRVANAYSIAYPSDIWKFDRLDYNFRDTTTSPDTDSTFSLRMVDPEEFRFKYGDNTIDATTVSDSPIIATFDDSQGIIRYYPPSETSGTAVFYLYYYKYLTELDSDGDEVEFPGTKIYKDFIRMKYYYKLAKRETAFLSVAQGYERDYERSILNLQRTNRRDVGSPRSFGVRGGLTYKGWRNA